MLGPSAQAPTRQAPPFVQHPVAGHVTALWTQDAAGRPPEALSVLVASYAGQSVNSGTERGKNPLTDAVRRAEQNKRPPRLHHHLTPQGGLNISEKDGAYCSPV